MSLNQPNAPEHRQNCWQFKQCGREPEGARVAELGVCPAAIDTSHNGTNRGKNAGRYCWSVAGTMCDGKLHDIYAHKLLCCIECDFFKIVQEQETREFAH